MRTVHQKVIRGSKPDHVKVVFEISPNKGDKFNVEVPKFVYHSKQGWTAAVDASSTIGENRFLFGILSDGDELLERYAGLRARYERLEVGTDRLQLSFEFESYHQQWNRATLVALEENPEVPGVYRTRQNFEPRATVVLARPLTLSFGVSFQRYETQFPAARTEASNEVVNTLRYHQRWESPGANQQELDAGYNLRAATRIFNSDRVFARHAWNVRYTFERDHNTVVVGFLAGVISGQAPLFERFVAGNSQVLRGWNKWDLDPLGGERLALGTIEYRYRIFQIFYDTGSVWDREEDSRARHSMGVGLRKSGFSLAVAFPIKEGRAEPIVLVGMNF